MVTLKRIDSEWLVPPIDTFDGLGEWLPLYHVQVVGGPGHFPKDAAEKRSPWVASSHGS